MQLTIRTITFLIVQLTLLACDNKRFNLVSTTTRKIDFTDNAFLTIKCFNSSDCNLLCKKQLTYVAINNNNFSIEAGFEIKFHFASHDSVTNKTNTLMPRDSVVIACGCEELVESNNSDWNMDLTIVSAIKSK